MAREKITVTTWTCDGCGEQADVDDMGSGYPPGKSGWRQIVFAGYSVRLGNLPSRDLCGTCANVVNLVLSGRAGDYGDLREAFRDGRVWERDKGDLPDYFDASADSEADS